MKAYPALKIDTFAHPEAQSGAWQSAMTFKFVGAIREVGNLRPYQLRALLIGLGIGFFTEVARKALARSARYRRLVATPGRGFALGWLVDTALLPSPYASSFGGFVDLGTSLWFGAGGVLASALQTAGGARSDVPAGAPKSPSEQTGGELPEDMSTTSLVGGGLIAGESLFALVAGIVSLLGLVG
jgi:hypothetical protein